MAQINNYTGRSEKYSCSIVEYKQAMKLFDDGMSAEDIGAEMNIEIGQVKKLINIYRRFKDDSEIYCPSCGKKK